MNFDDSRGQRGSQAWNAESNPFIPGSSRVLQNPIKTQTSFGPPYQDAPPYQYPAANPPSLGPVIGRAVNSPSLGATQNFYNHPVSPPVSPSKPNRYNNEPLPYASKPTKQSRGTQYQPTSVQPAFPSNFYQSNPLQAQTQASLLPPRSQPKVSQPKTQSIEDRMQMLSLGTTPPSSPIGSQAHRVPSGRRSIHSFFVSESLRHDLVHKNTLILKGTTLDEPVVVDLPPMIGQYHSFYPLEPRRATISKVFGVPTAVFKCHNLRDGLPYTLIRVDTPIRNIEFAQEISELWKQIQHSGIITLREVFRSSSSYFFAYDYHPGAETLESKYIQSTSTGYIQEDVLWAIIIQLVSVIQWVHERRQACRGILSPSKILVTSRNNRIRLNCVAIEDVLNPDTQHTVSQSQYFDLLYLGRLIVNLTCKSNEDNFAQWELLSESYSDSLNELVITLCKPPNTKLYPTIDDISVQINHQLIENIERLSLYNDVLEGELAKEIENGRLFRLLLKLGFINERPDGDMNSSWSETGDRYLVKLFRDYVFHQVYVDQSPVIDFAHVVSCLNKLDVGVAENILLQNRNEKSLLVVSYKDLKKIITDSFTELVAKSQFEKVPNYEPREWKGSKSLKH